MKKRIVVALIVLSCALIVGLVGCGGSGSNNAKKDTATAKKYELSYSNLGEYGKTVVLNKDTDMPVEKRLFKIPAGKYKVTTTNKKYSSFAVVKDEIGTEEGNSDYPETLQYVGEQYMLTAGSDMLNGRAKKEVEIVIGADESISLPTDTDTITLVEIVS